MQSGTVKPLCLGHDCFMRLKFISVVMNGLLFRDWLLFCLHKTSPMYCLVLSLYLPTDISLHLLQ
jgi:hypothetical protein